MSYITKLHVCSVCLRPIQKDAHRRVHVGPRWQELVCSKHALGKMRCSVRKSTCAMSRLADFRILLTWALTQKNRAHIGKAHTGKAQTGKAHMVPGPWAPARAVHHARESNQNTLPVGTDMAFWKTWLSLLRWLPHCYCCPNQEFTNV